MLSILHGSLVGPSMCSTLQRLTAAGADAAVWFETETPVAFEYYGTNLFHPAATIDIDARMICVHLRPLLIYAEREPGTLSGALWRTTLARVIEAWRALDDPAHPATGRRHILAPECSTGTLRILQQFAQHDARLGQPSLLEGYLGTLHHDAIAHHLTRAWGPTPTLLTTASTPLPAWLDESIAGDACGGQLSVTDLLRCLGFPDPRTHEALRSLVEEVAGHRLRAAPGASGTIHRFVQWGDVEPVWRSLRATVDLGKRCPHRTRRGCCPRCDDTVSPLDARVVRAASGVSRR